MIRYITEFCIECGGDVKVYENDMLEDGAIRCDCGEAIHIDCKKECVICQEEGCSNCLEVHEESMELICKKVDNSDCYNEINRDYERIEDE